MFVCGRGGGEVELELGILWGPTGVLTLIARHVHC